MTGGKAQLINGIALLTTFSGSRLIWGTYQSVQVYQDLAHVLRTRESVPRTYDGSKVMGYSDEPVLPLWLAYSYLISNTLLTVLNFYWFWRMIDTVLNRFHSPRENRAKLASE